MSIQHSVTNCWCLENSNSSGSQWKINTLWLTSEARKAPNSMIRNANSTFGDQLLMSRKLKIMRFAMKNQHFMINLRSSKSSKLYNSQYKSNIWWPTAELKITRFAMNNQYFMINLRSSKSSKLYDSQCKSNIPILHFSNILIFHTIPIFKCTQYGSAAVLRS